MSRKENIRALRRQAREHRMRAKAHEKAARECRLRIRELQNGERTPQPGIMIEMERVEIEAEAWPFWMQEQLRKRRRGREREKYCSRKGCRRKARFVVSDGPHGLSPETNKCRLCQVHVKEAKGFENCRRI